MRKLNITNNRPAVWQKTVSVFRRSVLLLGAFLIAFSSVQTALIFYAEGRAAAQPDDTISAVENNTPDPLSSEAVEDNMPMLSAVSDQVRNQVDEAPPANETITLPDEIDPSQEDVSERTPNSKTYKDGSTEIVEITGDNTSYQNPETGKLEDIKTDVVEDKEYIDNANKRKSFWQKLKFWDKPRAYKADGGPIDVTFPTLKNGDDIEISHFGDDMSMSPVNANNNIKPEYISNEDGTNSVRYSNVWDGVDLVYDYHGDTVKEMIVLREKPKQNSFEFEFGGDVELNKLQDGSIEVIKDGEPLFAIPAITVMVAQRGPVSDSGAQYHINGNRLTTSLEWGWIDQLNKENYPVAIDPTINVHEAQNGISGGGANYWSYKSDGYQCPSSSCYQNVGWLEDNGRKVWQTMMRIPFDEALGKDLVYAQLNVQKIVNSNGWYGTDAGHRYWITWAPCFGFGCVNGGAPWIPMSITNHGWIDLTSLVQWMEDHGQTGGWLMIHGDDSPYKALHPSGSKLSLVYNRRPSKPGLNAPANDTTQITTMPRLISNAATDPDGDALEYQFHVYDGDTLIAQSPWQAPREWYVPEGILQDGGTYRWRSVVRDSFSARGEAAVGKTVASDMWNFTVNLRQGNQDKTQTYDELGPISTNLANGNAYTALESHSIDSLGGDIGIDLAYNTPEMSQRGLTASYFNDTGGQKKVLQRTDPNVQFSWGKSSPAPGIVDSDNYSVNWKGYFIAPKTGAYKFGGSIDDKMDFNIDPERDGTYARLFNYDCCGGPQWGSTSVNLEEGKAYPISVNFHEYTGSASAHVWVRAPGYLDQVIPQDWLRTLDFVPTNDKEGLRAEFFKDYDQSRQFKSTQKPYLVKNYKQIDLNWGTGSSTSYDPAGSFKDNFLIRFSGYITIPTAGTYKFGVNGDDGKRLYINGNKVADQWNSSLVDAWSGNFFYNAGDVVPVVVEYYEAGGGASVELKWDGVAGKGIIPASALSISYRDVPEGWNLSLDKTGKIAYERLRVVSGGNVALISGDGSQRVYKRNGDSYKPPANQHGVLSKNEDGSYTLQDASGQVYEFDVKGVLTRLTSPLDDREPADLRYEYQEESGVPRLKKIVDGVDNQRYGELFYGGDGECQTPSGFDAAPAGFICAFKTYDGQISHFYYQNSQLARVELPGGSITDLRNDSKGRIVWIRDTMANDAIATGVRSESDELLTQISYDEIGRISSVKGPAAQPGAWRAEHTVAYGFRNTKRHVVGSEEPKGYGQLIQYDDTGRTTKVCDLQALCTTQEWHLEKDLLLSSVDALGQMSTTIYDDEDRPIDSYGPAPKDWFDTWNPILPADTELTRGQSIKSTDGRFTFTYQTNGNIVVRNQAGAATWHASMDGKASTRLRMQADGNLVLYNGSTAVWHTHTGGQGDSTSYLHMQNNGNLVIWVKNPNGTKSYKWTSGTAGATDRDYSTSYNKPKAAFADQVQHSSTGYDEGLTGPEVVWYNFRNDSLHGEPLYRETGFDQTNPSKFWLNTTNPSSPAVPVQPTDGANRVGFRATSELKVPTSGTYTLSLSHANAARIWVNDKQVIDAWDYRSNTVVGKTAQVELKSYESNKMVVEYSNAGGGDTAFRLELSGNGVSTPSGVWGNILKPGYGLTTSNTTHDAQLGNRKSTIGYGSRPEYGLAQQATVDPNGLNLVTNTEFEEPGSGYLRQTKETLPGSPTATLSYAYYGKDETRDNLCTPETESYRQAGRQKIKTEADPDGAGPETAVSHETIYDDAGQVVAVRTNDGPWTCVTYDERGRVVSTVVPSINGRPGRTETQNYSVDGNPLKTSVTDDKGTIVTEKDLKGNILSYTDVYGNNTLTEYDNFGRMTKRTSPVGVETFVYDSYDRVVEHKLDDAILASTTYDQFGRISSIGYPQAGQQALAAISYDQHQQASGLTWRLGDGTEVVDQVSRSQSGLVTSNTITSGGASSTWQYNYDLAQRLTQASLDGATTYAYSFGAQDSSCDSLPGVNPNAGKNSNRMSMTINGQATTYCYDQADRLVSTSDPDMSTIAYDDHNNTSQIGNTAFTYDATDRNIGISETKPDNTVIEVTYERDATDRIIASQKDVGGQPTQSIRYGFGGEDDAPGFLQDANGNVVESYLSLAGGVLVTNRPTETDAAAKRTHSLRNLHDDILLTTDANGQNTSDGGGPAGAYQYSPFGEAITQNPQNTETGTYGWVGTAQKTTEADLTLTPMQMGARVYIPSLGRFLQLDTVDGGNENTYVYPPNPVGNFDLEGKECSSPFGCAWSWIMENETLISAGIAAVGVAACIASVGCGVALGVGAVLGAALTVARSRYEGHSWGQSLFAGGVSLALDRVGGRIVDVGKVAGKINDVWARGAFVTSVSTAQYGVQSAANNLVGATATIYQRSTPSSAPKPRTQPVANRGGSSIARPRSTPIQVCRPAPIPRYNPFDFTTMFYTNWGMRR